MSQPLPPINPKLEIPPKLIPVFTGEAAYRGAYGGRGSAKTRTFALMAAVQGVRFAEANLPGVIVCGREFMNSLADSSFAEVVAAIQSQPWLAAKYEIGETYIRTRDGRIEFLFVGLRHNLDSIKSKARIRLLWVDEAEPVTEKAWLTAIPTVREHGSEIWLTWNPARKDSATHKRFRLNPPTGAKIVECNWRDNPWFHLTRLEFERLEDLEKRPDQYQHVWEGDFVSIVEGAYFAKHLALAKAQNRIGIVPADPIMTYRLFADIGGTGARADHFAFWVAQFIGKTIRVVDYYEAQGQDVAAHLEWMRSRKYTPGNASIWLPHDGAQQDRVFDASYQGAFTAAGYDTTSVPNQGKGAATLRIESARRLFGAMWFNEDTTQGGRDALGWYHEKKDEHRGIGLGPNHDWSSHAADAFGLMCIVYEEPEEERRANAHRQTSWMG